MSAVQLGLCCINTQLRAQKPSIYMSRTMNEKTIEARGLEALQALVLANLRDCITMMEWNARNGIHVFRLSSDMFPHKSNTRLFGGVGYTLDFALPMLQRVGDVARELRQRLTFHPGQYNVIGTPTAVAFAQTVADLQYHADVLDAMGMDKDSVMVVHGGGVYKDKQKTMERWVAQFHMLPQNVQQRLVLENCERSFSVEDCLWISERTGVPVVFDTHHFECYKLLHPDAQLRDAASYMPAILETWAKRGIKPKFHVSEQGSGKIGHHSDFVENIPDYLLHLPVPVDIMVEAKAKELAVLRLTDKVKAQVLVDTNVERAHKRIKLEIE
jgi:UV DNA damage endonuclease